MDAADLLPRCTFPPAGRPAVLRVLRRARLDRPARPRRRRRLRGHGVPRRPRAPLHLVRRGRRPPSHWPPPSACRAPSCRSHWTTGRTSKHGRAMPAAPRCRPAPSPGTPPTTGPRRSSSTSCAAPAPTGLAAMGPAATRPILDLRRAETVALCASRGLVPVVDPSNDERRFVRNRVRDELLPLMADIAGRDVVPLLVRTATLLADDVALAAGQAAGLDAADARTLAVVRAGPGPAGRPALADRHRRRRSGYAPDAATVDRVLEVARGERRACEIAGGIRVERHRQRLRIRRPDALVSPDGMTSGIAGVSNASRPSTAAPRRPARGRPDGDPTARPVGTRHHAAQLHVDPQGQAGDLRAPRRLRREPPPRAPPGGDHLDPRERLRLRDLDHPGTAQPPQLRGARRHVTAPPVQRRGARAVAQGVLQGAQRAAAGPT